MSEKFFNSNSSSNSYSNISSDNASYSTLRTDSDSYPAVTAFEPSALIAHGAEASSPVLSSSGKKYRIKPLSEQTFKNNFMFSVPLCPMKTSAGSFWS